MRSFLIAIAVTLIAAASTGSIVLAASQDTTPVFLKAQIVIEGPVVHLGDLFEGLDENAATPVARAPAPGSRVAVNARWLLAVAKAYAVPWRPRSQLDGTTIERASIVIGTRRIEGATIDALRQRGIDGRLSLVLDNPVTRILLPTDAASTLLVAGLKHNPATGRFTAHLIAPAEGTPLARITVSGRAIELIEVPVLRKRMMPGEVIRETDIAWQDVRADRIARNVVLDPINLVGMSPRRPVRAEKPVLISELRQPVLVPKNSLVTIRLQTARMVLTTRGRAMEQGAKGDVIRVVNTASNQIISASVTESGIVAVIPGGLRAEE
jgi:flagella basal body P-ring formation protein FlgA